MMYQKLLRQGTVSRKGFTIVELLVVIVVIGVLAAIVIVAYAGVRQSAINTSRHHELNAWRDLFLTYRTTNGGWPPSMVVDGEQCLGTGFPDGYGGVPRCHNYTSSDPSRNTAESGNATLMSELETVGRLAQGDRTPMNGLVGPYVVLKSDGSGSHYVRLTMTQYGTTCPRGTDWYWNDSTRATCTIEIH